jgi:hypothetical protein
MPDALCFVMGGLDVLVGLVLLFNFSNILIIMLGIAMLIKGGISFFG